MAKRDIDQQIRAQVDAFVGDLTKLIRQAALESVQDALGQAGSAAPRGRAAASSASGATRKKAPRRRKSGRRTPEDIQELAMSIYEYVGANAGQRLEEIGRGLDIATAELKRPIANLLGAKALKTTGQKRGTKYFQGAGDPAKASGAGPAPTKRKAPGRKKAAAKS